MTLAYQEFGKGYPIVLLHAFPLSGKMWQQNIEALVNNNFRVITPDLPGFGRSPLISEINTMEEMARQVADLLSELGIQKTILGGISMGGYTAFNFFKLFPGSLTGLILCDTTCRSDPDETRQNRLRLIKEINQNGSEILIKEMLPNLLSDFSKMNNQTLISDLEQEISLAGPKSVIAALRGMAERKDQTHLLNKIDIPTLLIYGEEDRPTNLETATFLNKEIAGSKLAVINNAGHYSNLENPTDFNSTLKQFLLNNYFEK
jgi:pimeloyl-ACP methyl ester carboxylesterase